MNKTKKPQSPNAITEKVIARLIQDIKMKPVNVIDIKEYLNIYEINTSEKVRNTLEIKPLYRVCLGMTMSGEDTFTIYDAEMITEYGRNELSFGIIKVKAGVPIKDGNKTLKNQDWANRIKGKLIKICDKMNAKEFFQQLEKYNMPWTQVLDYLIDDTGKKDERLMNIAKATYLPSSEMTNEYATINNHSLIVSNSGIGKSATFSRLTGKQPSTDYSIPGLIGTVTQQSTIVGGNLNGKGLYVFDEFPQTTEARSQVVASLLNYMESGETTRDLAMKVHCKGAKTLIFMGNIPREYNEKNFEETILKLAGQDAFQRVGRRLAHVLYRQDFKELNPGHENIKFVNFIRYALESAISQNQDQIRKITSLFRKWIYQEDMQYVNSIKSYAKYSSYRLVAQFLEGNSRSYSRIKNGALKWTILQHLDKICLQKIPFKELLSFLRVETYQMYDILKRYNYESYEFLLEGKKAIVIGMFKEGKLESQIAKELEITDHTVKKLIRDYDTNVQNNLQDTTIYEGDLQLMKEAKKDNELHLSDLLPINDEKS